LVIIVNPTAGRGRGRKAIAVVSEYLTQNAIEHTVLTTTAPGEATKLAREAAEGGEELVIACGGDGTMREVACGLLGTNAVMGLIPGGTGNDFATSIGCDKDDPLACIKKIMRRDVRKIDVGYANDMPFINICACGLDMDLFEASLPIKKRISGIAAYVLALFAILPKFHPKVARISVNGAEPVPYNVTILCVSNSPLFGGGMKAAPGALIDDGELDCNVIFDYYRRHIFSLLPRFIGGKYNKIKKHTFSRTTNVVVHTDKPVPFEVDGDRGPIADVGKPVTITLHHKELAICGMQ